MPACRENQAVRRAGRRPSDRVAMAARSRPRGTRTSPTLARKGSNVKYEVLARVTAVPGLSRSGPQIAAAVQSGEIRNVVVRLPEHARLAVGMITRAASPRA
jgi:hypothetical protein